MTTKEMSDLQTCHPAFIGLLA